MSDGSSDLNRRIAARVRELRAQHRLSLEELAGRSGVSRSMISVIERGESSPTAAVLQKLAQGLGVPLASFFDAPETARKESTGPVMRFQNQPQWKDPATGYIRRNVSPPDIPQGLRIVEVHFPPGVRVPFDPGANERPFHQQIWLLDGVMDIHVGRTRYQLRRGDCLAAAMDQLTLFHNPGRKAARYIVVTIPDGKSGKSG